jgi:hypothetical protein
MTEGTGDLTSAFIVFWFFLLAVAIADTKGCF